MELLILFFIIKLSVTTAEKSVKLLNTESLIKQQLIFVSVVVVWYSPEKTKQNKTGEMKYECLQSDTRI